MKDKKVLIFTSILFLILLIWQALSSNNNHQKYQMALMDSVTDRVINDYLEYFTQLRLEIDLFQQKYLNQIRTLEEKGNKAERDDYMPLYESFKSEISHSRLFALIDEKGDGMLKHITGDFLPVCKEEVYSTIKTGTQEQLFLHQSSNGLHFDLLQPLASETNNNSYFFAAFNIDVLQELIEKYRLPGQQLFLLRTDKLGQIELTTEQAQYPKMTITEQEINNFSFKKPVEQTRWEVAIRLDDKYTNSMVQKSFARAIVIWLLLTAVLVFYYRITKTRSLEHQALSEALEHKDNYDKLTGLANRKSFHAKLQKQIEQSKTSSGAHMGVVLHVDIDKFQVINKSFGHSVGDIMLLELSLALTTELPQNTIISRLGNDEFAILLPDASHEKAKDIAHKIRKLVKTIKNTDSGTEISLSASVGAFNLEESTFDVEHVLSSLSFCVDLAKEKGGNRVVLYDKNDPKLKQHTNEIDTIHILSKAFDENQFVLYRQEIRKISPADSLRYFEVLVRIKNSADELISPAIFIDVAEKHGLIQELDRRVIALTLKQMSKEQGNEKYSINLSGASLADRDIIEYVIEMFDTYNIDPKRICFEITETSAISHINSALIFMNKMIALGCTFALDDFGSGLSSFSYLQKLPIDVIKIDGAFVKDIDTNSVNRIFVENIKRTADAMNKRTVAEFVESQEILSILEEINIDYVQGYHVDKPTEWKLL